VKKIGWSGSGAGAGGRGAGNGAGSGSVRNRCERRAEILPLPLRSHALLVVHIHDKFSTETRQSAYALDVMHAFQVVRRGKIYRVS